MSGLDKILASIEQDTDNNVRAIIKSAEQQADVIKVQGDEQAKAAYDKYIEESVKQCEKDYANAISAANAKSKRELLECKINCIDKAIEAALNKLATLEDNEYFSFILKLAEKNIHSGDGVISFNANDLKRIPQDFERRLNELSDNCTIKISPDAAEIENGFLLSYGDISENCNFRDIAESKKDLLRDIVAVILFG